MYFSSLMSLLNDKKLQSKLGTNKTETSLVSRDMITEHIPAIEETDPLQSRLQCLHCTGYTY